MRGASRSGRGRRNCKYISGQGHSNSNRRVSLLVELISSKDSGFVVIYAHVITLLTTGHFCVCLLTTPSTDGVVNDTLLILAELNLFIKCMGLYMCGCIYTHPC